jgi:1,4-dihydroxy-2-naphthoate octaprenyltransferase
MAVRWRSLRAFSFPLSALPVVIGTAAVLPPGRWRVDMLAAAVVGAVLLHAAANLLNDFFDYHAGVDRTLDGDEGRPGRVLVRRELRPADVLREALVCLALVVPVAVYVVDRAGMGVLWFGLLGIAALYAYTGPPLRLKYRAFGEFVIIVIFGPALMGGAVYAQTGMVRWDSIVLSIPVGMMTMNVLLGNNIRDAAEDSDARIRTMAHVLGRSTAVRVYVLLLFAPQALVLVLAATGVVSRWTALSAVAAAPAVSVVRRMRAAHRIPDIDSRTARVATLFMLLLLVGLVLPA